MQNKPMFTGSSSNTFPKQQNFDPNFKTVETSYFGNIKITAPYSANLRFPSVNQNLSSQSAVLIHNIYGFKQHFGNQRVPGAFSYSISALNQWLSHLETRVTAAEERAAYFETIVKQYETEAQNLAVAKTEVQNLALIKEQELSEENKVLQKHFLKLKQKYDSILSISQGETNEQKKLNISFSKLSLKQVKTIFPTEIFELIQTKKEAQEFPVWLEVANFISNTQHPAYEKYFKSGCLKHIRRTCPPDCPFTYELHLVHLNLGLFEPLPIPNSSSTFLQTFGLTFGFLLDLGFLRSFRFTGKKGHDKLRTYLGYEHYMVRATDPFVKTPQSRVQVNLVSVPPAWFSDRFVPAQHNCLISKDISSWYDNSPPVLVTKQTYYNWRIFQTTLIADYPLGYSFKLMAQTPHARYYGDKDVADNVVPFVTIELSPEEDKILAFSEETDSQDSAHLAGYQFPNSIHDPEPNTITYLEPDSQEPEEPTMDIDWETHRAD